MNDSSRPTAESLLELLEERQHLLEIALWIFDSEAAADRIVQEAYRRWYALEEDARAAVAVPRAWLTKATGGICLELLSSAATISALEASEVRLVRSPRPVPRRPSATTPKRHARVLHRFAGACADGDQATIECLLAADVIVVGDGGGKVRTPVIPVQGAAESARFVGALLCGHEHVAVTTESVNGRSGLVLRRGGEALAVVSLSVAHAHITAVWITVNPDKLRSWHRF